jgi:hypothetical protein
MHTRNEILEKTVAKECKVSTDLHYAFVDIAKTLADVCTSCCEATQILQTVENSNYGHDHTENNENIAHVANDGSRQSVVQQGDTYPHKSGDDTQSSSQQHTVLTNKTSDPNVQDDSMALNRSPLKTSTNNAKASRTSETNTRLIKECGGLHAMATRLAHLDDGQDRTGMHTVLSYSTLMYNIASDAYNTLYAIDVF